MIRRPFGFAWLALAWLACTSAAHASEGRARDGGGEGLEPFPPTPFDGVIPLVLDPGDAPLAGRGRAERATYAAGFSGTLHLWTRAPKELDLFLRVETPQRELVAEDEGSGGGTTPWVSVEVEPGSELVVRVAASREDAAGAFELCAMAAPETAATRAAAAEARSAIGETSRLRGAGDVEAARARVLDALGALASVPGAQASELVSAAAFDLGVAAWDLSLAGPAASAWTATARHQARTLPADHRDLQLTRLDLAAAIREQGDLAAARALFEQVLESLSRTLPADHRDVQAARYNVAATMADLGDAEGARALEESVLEVYARTLPEDDPDVQAVRLGLASALRALGDLAGARCLQERVLAVFSRTLPADHPDLQTVRHNLAVTLQEQGDLLGARALQEQVLEVCSRVLPADHRDLQVARMNLAATLDEMGDLAGARALFEQVLDVLARTRPPDDSDLQRARANLAQTLRRLGDVDGAGSLEEQVLEIWSRTLPPDHSDLQAMRLGHAMTCKSRSDLDGARALEEQVVEVWSRTLPDDHPALQLARWDLALTILAQSILSAREPAARDAERAKAAGLFRACARAQVAAAREVRLSASRREAGERCASLAEPLGFTLSVALGFGGLEPMPELEPDAFAFSEATRNGGFSAAVLARLEPDSPRAGELRGRLRGASAELARLAREGTTSAAFQRVLGEREAVERELAGLRRQPYGREPPVAELDVAGVARALGAGEAAVAYRRFERSSLSVDARPSASGAQTILWLARENLCAFVVRGDAGDDALCLLDLGPIEPIERAVEAWRKAIGVGAGRGMAALGAEREAVDRCGDELRRLVLDPVLAQAGDARRVVVVLDDVLHLVPLDALPLASRELVGERRRIEVRSTLGELLDAPARPAASQQLLALGGASFNSPPAELAAEDASDAQAADPGSSVVRGAAWERGFTPLTYAGLEAREVAALHEEVFGSGAAVVLEKRAASRAALEALAPAARWLHVATHGWYASESIRSWIDPAPLDSRTGLGLRMSGEEQVKGMSPMLLSGLALAGANLPEDAAGRAPGLITADELSTLDLSSCELAVLSACDTSVGLRRAGQGVASLQEALHRAGARSVITSLWKVPDEATKELMLDFYRRMWVEEKPKAQALWEAKAKLREAVDESGAPRYTTRDWAAWVLTGED